MEALPQLAVRTWYPGVAIMGPGSVFECQNSLKLNNTPPPKPPTHTQTHTHSYTNQHSLGQRTHMHTCVH
jgi:hypothetical protein